MHPSWKSAAPHTNKTQMCTDIIMSVHIIMSDDAYWQLFPKERPQIIMA